jgi:hypothetical protein
MPDRPTATETTEARIWSSGMLYGRMLMIRELLYRGQDRDALAKVDEALTEAKRILFPNGKDGG